MRLRMGILAVVLAVAAGCAATPAEHSYVTDYQVVGDRTVKYIYRPGDESAGGDAYLDQAVAVEICSVASPGSQRQEGEGGDGGDNDDDSGEIHRPEQDGVVETDCRETRIMITEEYR